MYRLLFCLTGSQQNFFLVNVSHKECMCHVYIHVCGVHACMCVRTRACMPALDRERSKLFTSKAKVVVYMATYLTSYNDWPDSVNNFHHVTDTDQILWTTFNMLQILTRFREQLSPCYRYWPDSVNNFHHVIDTDQILWTTFTML